MFRLTWFAAPLAVGRSGQLREIGVIHWGYSASLNNEWFQIIIECIRLEVRGGLGCVLRQFRQEMTLDDSAFGSDAGCWKHPGSRRCSLHLFEGGIAACMKLVFSSISFCNDLLLEVGFGLHVRSQGNCGLAFPLLHIASFLDNNSDE